jgi:hypothetical protein
MLLQTVLGESDFESLGANTGSTDPSTPLADQHRRRELTRLADTAATQGYESAQVFDPRMVRFSPSWAQSFFLPTCTSTLPPIYQPRLLDLNERASPLHLFPAT